MTRLRATVARPQRGMTLVELLVGLAITALLMASMVKMLGSATAASSLSSQQLDLQARTQFALQRIALQIGKSNAAVLPDKADSKTSSPWPLAAAYTWVPGTGILSEQIGATTQVVAEGVSNFSITSPSVSAGQTLIAVSLTLSAGADSNSGILQARLGGAK